MANGGGDRAALWAVDDYDFAGSSRRQNDNERKSERKKSFKSPTDQSVLRLR